MMNRLRILPLVRQPYKCFTTYLQSQCRHYTRPLATSISRQASRPHRVQPQTASFHTSRVQWAQSPTADAVMEDLNELYATAKDEFEIAAEETEKKTVYAADDREAAREALTKLKEAFERASKESAPEVAKEVQGRVGSRIRELENAVTAMEERAMNDD